MLRLAGCIQLPPNSVSSPSAGCSLAHQVGEFANQKGTALSLSVPKTPLTAPGMPSVSSRHTPDSAKSCIGWGIVTAKARCTESCCRTEVKSLRESRLSTKSLFQRAADSKIKAHVELSTDPRNSRRGFQAPQQIFPLASGSRAESIPSAFGKSRLANCPPKGWQEQSTPQQC